MLRKSFPGLEKSKIFLLTREWVSVKGSEAIYAPNKFKSWVVIPAEYKHIDYRLSQAEYANLLLTDMKVSGNKSRKNSPPLRREINPMPKNIRARLIKHGLLNFIMPGRLTNGTTISAEFHAQSLRLPGKNVSTKCWRN